MKSRKAPKGTAVTAEENTKKKRKSGIKRAAATNASSKKTRPSSPADAKARAFKSKPSKKRTKRGRYISDAILARRRRMLDTTKKMIAEEPSSDFTIRDLAKRARVSVTTIYAAYGDKEGLIAAAIQDYYQNLAVANMPRPSTVSGVLRAIEAAVLAVLANPPYARQYASLFFSSGTDPRIQRAIRDTCIAASGYQYWLTSAMRRQELLPSLDEQYVLRVMSNATLATLHDWSAGRIASSELVREQQLSFLLVARGIASEELRPQLERDTLCRLRREVAST